MQFDHPEYPDLGVFAMLVAESAEEQDTPVDRRRMRRRARSLQRAAQWELVLNRPFRDFLLHVGLLRYGVAVGGTLSLALLLRAQIEGRGLPSMQLAEAVLWAFLFGVGLGLAAAASRWGSLRALVREAYAYRELHHQFYVAELEKLSAPPVTVAAGPQNGAT